VPFPDGETFKEITPDPAYVEGSSMAKRKGVYYLMWSEGDGPDRIIASTMRWDRRLSARSSASARSWNRTA
jgi:beta-xylosidase